MVKTIQGYTRLMNWQMYWTSIGHHLSRDYY